MASNQYAQEDDLDAQAALDAVDRFAADAKSWFVCANKESKWTVAKKTKTKVTKDKELSTTPTKSRITATLSSQTARESKKLAGTNMQGCNWLRLAKTRCRVARLSTGASSWINWSSSESWNSSQGRLTHRKAQTTELIVSVVLVSSKLARQGL